MTDPFRCSVASERLPEPLVGTASTVPAFLLVEAPGPWGEDAVRDSRLPDEVKRWLATLQRQHRVRPLLVRRHHRRPPPSRTRVFAAFVADDTPWVETTELDDVRQVTDLDVAALGRGESVGLTSYDEPLFLVCTHGRHDACCAERGRPLCKAFHDATPEHTWEVSHIGGDRFAANVLVLPEGLYYGRLEPTDAEALVAKHRAGALDLEHLRGRCAYPFPVQAAEIYLRRHIDVTEDRALSLRSVQREEAETVAVFEVGDVRWRVRVHTEPGGPRRLTCRAGHGRALQHRLVALDPTG